MFHTAPLFAQMPDRPSVHCATLTELPGGTLLAAWFAGSHEMARDVVLMSARLAPGSDRWSAPQVLVEVPGRSLGQPVFLLHPTYGELWFFFNVIMDSHWTSAQPYWQRSTDGGYTWQPAQQIMDYPGMMFRSKPFLLPGRIILPAYDEVTWQSRMMISDDDGQSWRLTDPLTTPRGNIHPCIVQSDAGSLLAYLRTGGKGDGGVIWRTESHDSGDTWSNPTATALPNPNAGIDLIRLTSGALLLAYNPVSTGRTPLNVAWSTLDETWPHQQALQDMPGEYSYPTLLQSTDGTIHMVYTYRREHIQYVRFDEAWVKGE